MCKWACLKNIPTRKSREYYTIAVTKEYSGIEFSLAYTDADWDASKSAATNQKDEFLVLSLSKSF